jgi:acetyl esterase/lipase
VITRRAVLGLLAGGVVAACSGGSGNVAPSTRSPNGPGRTVRYGDGKEQMADLWLPTPRSAEPVGVVVLVHGGFWRPIYDRTLMDPLARDLTSRGWAAWNLDYRGSGDGGGGWPATFEDVAAGIDALVPEASPQGLDLDRVVVVGHSAGGCLSLWAAARAGLPDDAPGAGPEVEPVLAVSLAGVNNLVAGAFEQLGNGAIEALMGKPPKEAGDRYTLASPVERLPIGVDQIVVHGLDDDIVPVDQSTAYAGKAKEAGDDVTVITVEGADHFDLIAPTHRAWKRTIKAIEEQLDA